jgi:hypothetical protein
MRHCSGSCASGGDGLITRHVAAKRAACLATYVIDGDGPLDPGRPANTPWRRNAAPGSEGSHVRVLGVLGPD